MSEATHATAANGVRHNAAESRFEIEMDGATAFAEYHLSPGVITFTHTLTPSRLRGRGLAAKVVKAGLEHARAEKLKVVPRCWYVAEYIGSHPEFQDLVAR